MKNEKMKRVAALALAGTIAVSTISPAAFAAGENEEGENQAVPSVLGDEEEGGSESTASKNAETVQENQEKQEQNDQTVTDNSSTAEDNSTIVDNNPDLSGDDGLQLNPIEPPTIEELPSLPEMPENPTNEDIGDYNDAVGENQAPEGEDPVYPEGSYNDAVTDYNDDVKDYNDAVEDYNDAADQHNENLDDKLFGTEGSEGEEGGDGSGEGTTGLLEDNDAIAGDPNTAEEGQESNATGNEAVLEDNADLVEGTDLTGEQIAADREDLDHAKAELEAAQAALEAAQADAEKWEAMPAEDKNELLQAYQDKVDSYNQAVENYNKEGGTLDQYEEAINDYNDEKIDGNETITSNNTANKDNNDSAFADEDLEDYLGEGASEQLGALDGVTVPSIDAALSSAGVTFGEGQSMEDLSAEDQAKVIAAYNQLVEDYNKAVAEYNEKDPGSGLTIIEQTYQEALKKYNAAVKEKLEGQMDGGLVDEDGKTNTAVDEANEDVLEATGEGSNADAFESVDAANKNPGADLDLTMPTLEAALKAAKDKAIKEAAEAVGVSVDQLDEETKAEIAAQYDDADKLTAENQAAVVDAFNALVDEYNAKVSEYNDGKDTDGDGVNEILSAQEAYDQAWKEYNQSKVEEAYGTEADEEAETEATGNVAQLENNSAALSEAKEALTSIRDLVANGKITLSEDQKAALTAALGQIGALEQAGANVDAVEMPDLTNLDFSNCESDADYDQAVENALAAYQNAVDNYNTAVNGYDTDAAEDLLEAVSETIKEENAEKVEENLDAANDAVYGIETTISSNNANQDKVLSNAIEDGLLEGYKDGSITTKEQAQAELETLTGAVNGYQDQIKNLLTQLQELDSSSADYVESYNALVNQYNDALEKCEKAIEDYNAFVAACNPEPTLPSDSEGGSSASETVDLGELTYDTADNKWYKDEGERWTNGGWSDAKYYIQIEGEVPFEDQDTAYPNDYYVQVGAGAVKDATLYPNESTNSSYGKTNVSEGYNRVDVPTSAGIITKNEYNNTVINLDNVLIQNADGASTPLEGLSLQEQLELYYNNVYNVLIDGTVRGGGSVSAPDDDSVLEKVLDEATYEAYKESGGTSMGVLWYVVKDSNTGTNGDGVHVDGVVYFTGSGVVYDQGRFSALSQDLSPLESLISTNIKTLGALNKIENTETHQTLQNLGALTKIDTTAADYKEMKQGATILTLTEVDALKDPTQLEELDKLETLNISEDGTQGNDRYAATLETLNTLETLQPLELLPTSGGTGDGETELPPEEEEDDDLVLILTDVPTEEEIVEEEIPLASAPETEIEEEDVPLTDAPTEEVEIEEEETPLSSVPKTGDESGIFLLMSMISGMALAALSFIDRKGRHARFGSQH